MRPFICTAGAQTNARPCAKSARANARKPEHQHQQLHPAAKSAPTITHQCILAGTRARAPGLFSLTSGNQSGCPLLRWTPLPAERGFRFPSWRLSVLWAGARVGGQGRRARARQVCRQPGCVCQFARTPVCVRACGNESFQFCLLAPKLAAGRPFGARARCKFLPPTADKIAALAV